mmetsp:Transcript_17842/g.37118  ORF Transcript_17842/g.37118 Transcript_17842/m.37118 type:complete len:217 (-) Transcript_17842:691-1341(-)
MATPALRAAFNASPCSAASARCSASRICLDTASIEPCSSPPKALQALPCAEPVPGTAASLCPEVEAGSPAAAACRLCDEAALWLCWSTCRRCVASAIEALSAHWSCRSSMAARIRSCCRPSMSFSRFRVAGASSPTKPSQVRSASCMTSFAVRSTARSAFIMVCSAFSMVCSAFLPATANAARAFRRACARRSKLLSSALVCLPGNSAEEFAEAIA